MQKFDLLVVGAGPAGLTAAQYGARAGLRVLVPEADAVGGQALFIDNLENYPGNVAGKSGGGITVDMHKQAMDFGAEFIGAQVLSISQNEGTSFWTALLSDGMSIQIRAVILASGARNKTLDIPGEAEFAGSGVSYCAVCDGPFFKGKKIFVVGGGDAACDEARFLGRLSQNINLIHRRDKLRAQKSIANRVYKDPAINVRLCLRILEIKGGKKVESVVLENTNSGEKMEEAADAVFVFTGITPQNELALGSGLKDAVKLDKGGFIITNQGMATSVPGLFAAGDVRSTPFRQVVVACGEGAIAAHSAAEYIQTLGDQCG